MKPFDLTAAKRGEPVQCCGLSAKFVAYEIEAAPYEQLMYLGHGNQLFTAHRSGVGYGGHKLVMAPKTRTVWVNLYPSYKDPFQAICFDTEEAADNLSAKDRIGGKAYPVEIEL